MIELPTPALIGVVHLPALPGSPANLLPVDEIISRAVSDAVMLSEAGFDALIVENFGDKPFQVTSVEPATIAALALVAHVVRLRTNKPVGVNVLRNDAIAALGIAAATGATFIRVNVFTGVSATDQGIIEGQADRVLRYRKQLGTPIAVLADVHVKHAVSMSQPDIAEAAKDAAYRGLADGLIVTGPATGEPINFDDLLAVRNAVPDRRILVGSGVTHETVANILSAANGVIVGTSLKEEGMTDRPVDPERAKAFVLAAKLAKQA